MKYIKAVLVCSVLLTGTQSATIGDAEYLDTKKGFLMMDFEKKHGENINSASKDMQLSELLLKRDDYDELVMSNGKTFYTANLTIGSSREVVSVAVDTGSSDLWVMGSSNSHCKDSAFDGDITTSSDDDASGTSAAVSMSSGLSCKHYGTFDTSKSTTFKDNGTSFFNSYHDTTMASGPWGTDSVGFGNITLNDVTFGVANVSNTTFGIFGIGLTATESTYLTSNSNNYQYQNFPAALADQGYIKKNAYSLFLDDQNSKTGSVLFGAVDHSKYTGQLYTLPLLKFHSSSTTIVAGFDVTVQGVGITDGNSVYETTTTVPFPVLLDSGTSFMYLPYTLSDLIAEQVGASFSSSVGYYFMDCPNDDDPSQIIFDFGGFQISNYLTNYMISTKDPDTCILGIIPSEQELGILGDVFLVDAYVVYDLEKLEVSIAQANFDTSDPDIEIISSSVPSAIPAPSYSKTFSTNAEITAGGNIFTLSTTYGSSRASQSPESNDDSTSEATQSAASTSTTGTTRSPPPSTGVAASAVSQTTASSAGASGATQMRSSTATATIVSSTAASTTKQKNGADNTAAASFFFIFSSMICALFL